MSSFDILGLGVGPPPVSSSASTSSFSSDKSKSKAKKKKKKKAKQAETSDADEGEENQKQAEADDSTDGTSNNHDDDQEVTAEQQVQHQDEDDDEGEVEAAEAEAEPVKPKIKKKKKKKSSSSLDETSSNSTNTLTSTSSSSSSSSSRNGGSSAEHDVDDTEPGLLTLSASAFDDDEDDDDDDSSINDDDAHFVEIEPEDASAPPASATDATIDADDESVGNSLSTPSINPSSTSTSTFSPSSPYFDRYEWTEQQLQLRESEYVEEKTLKLFLGTWNVNAKKPAKDDDLTEWLAPREDDEEEDDEEEEEEEEEEDEDDDGEGGKKSKSKKKRRTAADIYGIGFQEIVDLNATNLVVDHNASDAWEFHIHSTLSRATKFKYIQIASIHLVGLSLSVYVKEKLRPYISDIRTASVGVGIMGVGGNKGAVLCRFNLHRSSYVIVNSHLAAHQKNVKARNSDYHNIMRKSLLVTKYTDAYHTAQQHTGIRRPSTIDPRNRQKLKGIKNLDGGGGDEGGEGDEGQMEDKNYIKSGDTMLRIAEVIDEVNLENVKQLINSGITSLKDRLTGKYTEQKRQAELAAAMAAANSPSPPPSSSISSSSSTSTLSDSDGITIYDHDHIFWIGDLNYRINLDGMEQALELIRKKKFKTLLNADQLILEKQAGNAFVGFNEGIINFAPTYKYATGTNEYDRRGEDKKPRLPAWCDRIQWCSNEEEKIQQHYYRRAELTLSDHKPVMSLFTVPAKIENLKKKNKIRMSLEKLTEKQCRSKMAISSRTIDWGSCRFDVKVIRKLLLKNTGQAVIVFHAISEGVDYTPNMNFGIHSTALSSSTSLISNKNFGSISPFKPFLTVSPPAGVLTLNSTVLLTLTLHMDRRSAHSLNIASSSLSTPLLLLTDNHTHRYTVICRGNYLGSCLGGGLEWCNRVPVGEARRWAGKKEGRERMREKAVSTSVPNGVWRIVETILKEKGHAKKNIWGQPRYELMNGTGSSNSNSKNGKQQQQYDYTRMVVSSNVRYIWECIDTGYPFPPIGPSGSTFPPVAIPFSSYPVALMYYLHSLPRPLFSRSSGLAWERFTPGVSDLTSWCYQALLDLPIANYRLFVYLMGLLREVAKRQLTKEGGVTVDDLCAAWATPVMHLPPHQELHRHVPLTPVEVVRHYVAEVQFAKRD